MKRYISLFTALLATATVVFAQDFEFQYHGQSLDDDATVFIEATVNAFDEFVCETNPASNPFDGLVLKLFDATNADVSAKLVVGNNGFQAQVIQWCMGGNCSLVRAGNTYNKTFTMGSVEQVQLDASIIMGKGMLDAALSVTIAGVEKTVNILFSNTGEDGISFVPADGDMSAVIYSVDGRKLSSSHRGINIVRMKDGSVKKLFVR